MAIKVLFPFEVFKEPKNYDIISVSRPSIQKVNKKLKKEKSIILKKGKGKIFSSRILIGIWSYIQKIEIKSMTHFKIF